MPITDYFQYDAKQEAEPQRVKPRFRHCYMCKQPNDSVKLCAKCKSIGYCSRECQKKDWSKHKNNCNRAASEMGLASMCKFMGRLYDDDSLVTLLEIAILHKLQSLKLELSTEAAFTVLVVVGIEPVDIQHFGALKTSIDFVEGASCPLGMLQVLSLVISPEPPIIISTNASLSRMQNAIEMNAIARVPVINAVLSYFRPKIDSGFDNYTSPRPIPVAGLCGLSLRFTKTLTIPDISGSGPGVVKPLTTDTCLELINMKIRRDHENRYRLRKRMQREDMKMIHMATNAKCPGGRLDPYGAQWVEKIFREDIYDAIPETGEHGLSRRRLDL